MSEIVKPTENPAPCSSACYPTLFTVAEAVSEIKQFPKNGEFFSLATCFRKLGDREIFFSHGENIIKVGKTECEPENWRRYYCKLASLGVIEFEIKYKQGKGMKNGGPFIKGFVKTTEFGKAVREQLYVG